MTLFQKVVFVFSALCGVVVLLSLGTWQVFRLEEKQNLFSQIENGFSQAPQTFITVDETRDVAYQRFLVGGHILLPSFRLLQQKRNGQNGQELLVGLQEGDTTLLVNFGWRKDLSEIKWEEGKHYLLMGYFVPFSKPNMFRPHHEEGARELLWIEKEFIEREMGQPVFDYVFRVSETLQGMPNVIPHEIKIDIPNNHFQYAVFWYVMALILTVMSVLVWRKKQ